jgi:hypothetical protein
MRQAGAALDLAAVAVFVTIGRAVHTDGLTGWPFVSGLAAGWVALSARHLPGTSVADGVLVLVSTVVIGMTLRVVSAQGIAFAFVLVALGFLGAAMIGWRVLFAFFRRPRFTGRAGR